MESSVIQALGMGSSAVAPPPRPPSTPLRRSPPDKELEAHRSPQDNLSRSLCVGEKLCNDYKIPHNNVRQNALIVT